MNKQGGTMNFFPGDLTEMQKSQPKVHNVPGWDFLAYCREYQRKLSLHEEAKTCED